VSEAIRFQYRTCPAPARAQGETCENTVIGAGPQVGSVRPVAWSLCWDGKGCGRGGLEASVSVLALPPTTCMTLGESLALYLPQFPDPFENWCGPVLKSNNVDVEMWPRDH
jgi:hypothetical protein